jgi:hypothetical protein
MKNLFFTLAFSLFASTCIFAQQTFHTHPDTVSVSEQSDVYNVPVYNNIDHLVAAGDTVFVKWERTVLVNPNNLETQVCDPVACFAAWVDTHTFPLVTDTNIIVYLLNPNSVDPYYAVVQLKFTDIEDPANPRFSYYIFNIGTSSTDGPAPVANVKLYPNPVVESFTLENTDDVHRILVFAADGRQVATFQPNAGQSYSLAGQPAGQYAVALEAKSGKVFQVISVRKN